MACDTRRTLRLLFIPVSARRGTGEYARALAIASEYKRLHPDADIRFVVSREAPYVDKVPFLTTVLPASPTFHPGEVARLLREFRPDLVFLDNAGRTSQLRVAREIGAKIVYVSSRARQRRRAFRTRWMRLIDEHWIAMPEVIAGPLTSLERLKLRLLGRPRVRYLDTILPNSANGAGAAVLATHDVRADQFVLVVPGGGAGHARMRDSPRIIARAAQRIARHRHPTLLIGVAPDEDMETVSGMLRVLPLLPMAELVELIRHAKLVVVNGADTLLQVLACGRASVAVPMAPDQVRRLARLSLAGVHVGVPLDADAIERRALQLLDSELARRWLIDGAAMLGIANAMGSVQQALEELTVRRAPPSTAAARPPE